jgi:tetratricopeptide (TPR) repeat protein
MSAQDTKLSQAIELRKNKKPSEAKVILAELLNSEPNNPDFNYQMAWICDLLGKESEAVPFYERAIANGLVDDRVGAMVGLGSTYRCLGEYEKSLKVLDQGITEFPDDRPLRVFRALTLYNLGQCRESVSQLLLLLLDSTADASVKSYDGALRFYSDKLDEQWK